MKPILTLAWPLAAALAFQAPGAVRSADLQSTAASTKSMAQKPPGPEPAAGVKSVLRVTLAPRFAGDPLMFDAVSHTTAQGQRVSVTRLDFLLSNIALRRADGAWLGLTNWFAYLSPREGRTRFELNNLPAGHYDRVRFQVGVPAAFNHADPAQFHATHPLNPTVNGLHWNWQGGYVFFAMEGHWQPAIPAAQPVDSRAPAERERAGRSGLPFPPTDSSTAGGYSYHLANDRLLTTVELPVALDLFSDRELHLALNLDRIFSGPHAITITEETASTHSREGDPLADQLRDNLQRAFAVERVDAIAPAEGARAGERMRPGSPSHTELLDREGGARGAARPTLSFTRNTNGTELHATAPLIASDATPYPLTLPRFFPRPALPLDNPLSAEGVQLGRLLFFDPRLSGNNAQSCASCHQPGAGFIDRDRAFSLGAEGQSGTRNAMPLLNLAWKSAFFWDGRSPTLREQVLQPIQNPIEMHQSLERAVAKIRSAGVNRPHQERALRVVASGVHAPTPTDGPLDYLSLFDRAFGSREITADRLARALEQFLLTLVSHDSKFDRFAAGQASLTDEELRGLELFRTEHDRRRGQFGADCFHCHGGPLFQSQTFANNGLDAEPRDLGRFLVTGKAGDRGKFAVPSLRNVARTAPYMHDGRFTTLEEVVEHYATGVKRSPTLDPNLAKHPGGGVPLSAADKQALVAFLKTLTEE